jgi:hypothetical protein
MSAARDGDDVPDVEIASLQGAERRSSECAIRRRGRAMAVSVYGGSYRDCRELVLSLTSLY